MRVLRPAVPALLLLVLGGGVALSQSAVAPGGALPPPRPVQAPTATPAPPTTTPPPTAAAPTAPRPPAQQAQPRPAQATPQARPPQPGQPRPPGQQARPQGQAQRQPPAVGRQPQPQNRRPAAAAAGVAAGAAAGAAGAAATQRTPEPAAPPPPPMPTTGSVTGLALPRFASLRSDEVNMRVGPGTNHPVEWRFERRDLPVQIIGEFQLWRRIRDVDGAEGWVHTSTLAGRRTALVRPQGGATEVTLRRRAEENGLPVARLRPGVIARLRECEAGSAWCEVQVGGHRGHLRRADLWGVGAEEEIK